MENNLIVFEFKIWFDYDEEHQCRYVLAEDEWEAEEKLRDYYEKMHAEGYAKPKIIAPPTIEVPYIII